MMKTSRRSITHAKDSQVDRCEGLVRQAQDGSPEAMEKLILRHRKWISNVALKLTRNAQDVDDVTQEVLLIIITKIGLFKGKSSFRTWLYRIISNHVINMERKNANSTVIFFNQLDRYPEDNQTVQIPDPRSVEVGLPVIIEEMMDFFRMGLILCLNLEQRLIFLAGEIMGINDVTGSRLFEISRVNYRKRLSRAKRSVYSFVRAKYGS